MATQPVGQVINPGMDEEEEIVTGGTLSAIEEADRSSMVATAKKLYYARLRQASAATRKKQKTERLRRLAAALEAKAAD